MHQLPDPLELGARDDGGEGVLDPHRRGAVLGVEAPDEGAGVGLVGEQAVHGGLEPGLAVGRRNAVGVERAGDVEHALTGQRIVEDAPHDGVGRRVEFQPGAGLGAVGDVDLAVAVRRPGGDPEAARGSLAHAAGHFLGEALGVELIDALDDRLHQLAGGGVVGVLGD
ncbi:MAG: hypothetical protein OXD50_01780 [Chloroflexi bacterium]|nr:hypothetical protein [Chloroflexota bacterium]